MPMTQPTRQELLAEIEALRAQIADLQAGARETALRDGDQLFRAIFERAPVGIAQVALDGSWLRANGRLHEILGYTPEELSRLNFQTVTHPDDLAAELEEIARLERGEIGAYAMEKRYIRSDGEVVWVQLTRSLVRDAQGRPAYFVTIADDITERRRTKLELAESREHLRFALEAARLGTWEWDASRQQLSLAGYAAELLGLPGETDAIDPEAFAALIYPDDRDTVIGIVEESFDDSGDLAVEFRYLRPSDGARIWLEARGKVTLDANGWISRISGIVQDITERKLIERERIRILHREREANAAKTRFLAMVSHELRTPLTSIKGFASTLLADDVEWDADSQRDFIVTIAEEADKLHELVEQLLDASRLQSGRLQISPSPCSIHDVLAVAKAQIDTLAAAHDLRLEIASGLPALEADPRRIAQVLSNLVSNAAKHSPPGSPITIKAYSASDVVRVDVIDRGKGIPEEARDHVFEAFQQLVDDNSDGAGLGLAICKGLIEAHGGRIWIAETSPAGTTMSFTLPLQASRPSGSPIEQPAASRVSASRR